MAYVAACSRVTPPAPDNPPIEKPPVEKPPPKKPVDLRINEVVSNNEGVWIDEAGETDDYVELFNASDHALALGDYEIGDKSGLYALPSVVLPPGGLLLFWADDTPAQGLAHLPFKISASGESLVLVRSDGQEVDRVAVPALDEHHAFARMPDGTGAFADCGWATPGRVNGASCGPPPPPPPADDLTFADFTWPDAVRPSGMVIRQAALRPAQFVELGNRSQSAVDLTDYHLRIAPHRDGEPAPAGAVGQEISLPVATVPPGGVVRVDLTEADCGRTYRS